MADMHTLNTRIKLKYDSYTNWLTNDPVLLAGEVAVATIETTEAGNTGFQNLPNVVIKVGNGTAKYSELKFVSGLAADVYDWAKASTKPEYQANEIKGLEGFIAGEIQDTDTRYKLVATEEAPYIIKLMSTDSDPEDTTFDTEVARIDLSSLDTRLAAVEGAVGPSGSVSKQISDAVAGIALAEQTVGQGKVINTIKQENGIVSIGTRDLAIADIAGLQDALDNKEDDLVFDGTVSAENKVATQATVTAAIEALDKADAAVTGQFVTAVKEENGIITVSRAALKATDIPTIEQSQVDGLTEALNGKQEKLYIAEGYNQSNPIATVKTVTDAVADLEGAMHFVGRKEEVPTDNAEFSAGDVILVGDYEYVFDGAAWLELGNTGLYQLKADAESQHQAMQSEINALKTGKQDKLAFEGTPSDTNKVATASYVSSSVQTAIEGLDYAGGAFGDNKFVTKVTENNGVVEVTYAQPAIANINGLTARLTGIDNTVSTGLAAKQDVVGFADGYNKDTNKAATVKTVTNAIDALNANDAAVAGQFVTEVKEEAGIVKVQRAAITTDMVQQGTNVLVFDCGTSAI